ncbi:MAG: hypothetical protein LBV19_07325, partial [Streptococcaceae bacterium]|nr:hypothetical protein [Streptococcaceae bacterium]
MKDYKLPLTFRYNFTPVLIFGAGSFAAGVIMLMAALYGALNHNFTDWSVLFVLAGLVVLGLGIIYFYEAFPFVKNKKPYLIISDEGLFFPERPIYQLPLVEWSDVTSFEEFGKKFDGIAINVKNREKYLSPKDLQLIEKKPSRKDKICD